jgi:hypothetical protein
VMLKVCVFHRYELCYFVVINTACVFPSLGVYILDMYYTVCWFDMVLIIILIM